VKGRVTGKARIRLDPDSYRQLHRQVLQRDSWRCQLCGSLRRLEVHHLQFRSQLGEDSEDNLITVCASCHAQLHKSPKQRQR
jgi:5-methylcytosine-specific restriction endonuclease McrA